MVPKESGAFAAVLSIRRIATILGFKVGTLELENGAKCLEQDIRVTTSMSLMSFCMLQLPDELKRQGVCHAYQLT